tara:strand:- start:274 stop:552 length:279 start_codon:yes stop_codon:yes gene_type:complete
MSTENGQVEHAEIIPDFENEIVEEMPQQQQQAPPSPCGCNKGKNTQSKAEMQTSINWMRIGMIAGGLVVAYFIFKNMSKGKIETPKVEIPEV